MKKLLITTSLLLLLAGKIHCQHVDPVGVLKADRLNISINSIEGTVNNPSFEQFVKDFRLGNNFITSSGAAYQLLPSNNTYTYSGFQIQFEFASRIFKDSLARARNKFSFGFESGTARADLYLLEVQDIGTTNYEFRSNSFRLIFGYKRFLTKKNKRLRFHTGAELVHEFQISAFIIESDDRDFFAKKGYNLFINIPVGLDWRIFRRVSFFLHLNTMVGYEHLDPIKQFNTYSGTKLGFSLPVSR